MTYSDVFRHVIDYVVQRIIEDQRTGEAVIWGGDFNQGLSGRDYVGTLQGRATLLGAMETFGLQVPTRDLPAKIEAHPAIDHIAIPAAWRVVALPEPHTPERDGRPLSDHALYLVRAEST